MHTSTYLAFAETNKNVYSSSTKNYTPNSFLSNKFAEKALQSKWSGIHFVSIEMLLGPTLCPSIRIWFWFSLENGHNENSMLARFRYFVCVYIFSVTKSDNCMQQQKSKSKSKKIDASISSNLVLRTTCASCDINTNLFVVFFFSCRIWNWINC